MEIKVCDIIDEVNEAFQNGQVVFRGKTIPRLIARAMDLRTQVHQLKNGLMVRFNYYEADGYFECWYCSHGWLITNEPGIIPPWKYCPNCGHKIGEVVRIKTEEEND